MTHYTSHAIVVQDTADASPVIIGSVLNSSLPIAQEVMADATSGRFYPEQISVVSQKPTMAWGSYDLPKVIGAFGLTGRMLTEGVSKPGIALYQAKYNDASLASGSVHRRLRFPKAYAMISRITASHRQDAQAELSAMAIWDKTNNPVLIEGTQALPTLPASSGRWTVRSASVGGVDINCNIQVDIDFGISATTFGCDGDIWDTHLELTEIKPIISITSLDPEGFGSSTVPLLGLVGAHADTEIILRKRSADLASFVAGDDGEHILITAAGTAQVTEAHNGSANQRAQTQIQIHCRYDGTNAPLIFDTTYAWV